MKFKNTLITPFLTSTTQTEQKKQDVRMEMDEPSEQNKNIHPKSITISQEDRI